MWPALKQDHPRAPNVVQARTKQAAIFKLNEMDNAEGCPFIKLDECQIHFRLTDEGQLELQTFGEETESGIWAFCYPVLDGVLPDKSSEDWSATEREAVHQAVRQERDRVFSMDVRPKISRRSKSAISLGNGTPGRIRTCDPRLRRPRVVAAVRVRSAFVASVHPSP